VLTSIALQNKDWMSYYAAVQIGHIFTGLAHPSVHLWICPAWDPNFKQEIWANAHGTRESL